MIHSSMKKILILGLLGLFGMTAVHAELKPGANAPAFSAQAALAGNTFTFSLAEALKKGAVVVYFYPKAFTTGCTIEANLFAQSIDEFSKNQSTVIGVSGDDIETLKKFSTGPCGGKFAVAADEDRSIMKSYDAALKIIPSMADRISYVITPDMKILSVFSSMNPEQHVSRSLEAVKAWNSKNTTGK